MIDPSRPRSQRGLSKQSQLLLHPFIQNPPTQHPMQIDPGRFLHASLRPPINFIAFNLVLYSKLNLERNPTLRVKCPVGFLEDLFSSHLGQQHGWWKGALLNDSDASLLCSFFFYGGALVIMPPPPPSFTLEWNTGRTQGGWIFW